MIERVQHYDFPILAFSQASRLADDVLDVEQTVEDGSIMKSH